MSAEINVYESLADKLQAYAKQKQEIGRSLDPKQPILFASQAEEVLASKYIKLKDKVS